MRSDFRACSNTDQSPKTDLLENSGQSEDIQKLCLQRGGMDRQNKSFWPVVAEHLNLLCLHEEKLC